jgi:hypothetical protein
MPGKVRATRLLIALTTAGSALAGVKLKTDETLPTMEAFNESAKQLRGHWKFRPQALRDEMKARKRRKAEKHSRRMNRRK